MAWSFRRRSRSSSRPTTLLGKVGQSLFFFIFFAMGAAFCVLLSLGVLSTIDTWTWEHVDCRIVSSELVSDTSEDEPHELKLAYTYTYEGREYTGHDYQRDDNRFDSLVKAQRLLDELQPGVETTCYVDSGDPTRAALERSSAWFGFFLIIPLIFVAIGAGGIYYTWFGGAKTDAEGKPTGPLTSRVNKNERTGIVIMAILFTAFALMGGGAFYAMFIRPVMKINAATDWPEVPCTILSSEVGSHSDDDGTTYSVDIAFEYEFDGRSYRSDTYSFVSGSSSGYEGKARVVKQYPAGAQRTCFVNPDDPYEAVIHREMTGDLWFGLIPLVFLLVGVGGWIGMLVWWGRRGRKRSRLTGLVGGKALSGGSTTVSQSLRAILPDFEADEGPVQLKPKTGRVGKLVGIIFFALVWNGIVSIFVTIVVKSHLKGDPEWFLTIFIIPFVLIGLGTIFGIFYYALALLNPRPQVTVNRRAVPLGQPFDIAWDVVGKVEKISRFEVTLIGREEAKYQRGTDTVTDHNTFAKISLVDTQATEEIGSGVASTTIPADTMHSLELSHNKIQWRLKVRGHIRRWPDVSDEFEIVVLPVVPAEESI